MESQEVEDDLVEGGAMSNVRTLGGPAVARAGGRANSSTSQAQKGNQLSGVQLRFREASHEFLLQVTHNLLQI